MNNNFDDWNDEGIWIEIESRLPKKRNRRLLFWIFGALVMLSSIGTYSYLESEADAKMALGQLISKSDIVNQEVINDKDVVRLESGDVKLSEVKVVEVRTSGVGVESFKLIESKILENKALESSITKDKIEKTKITSQDVTADELTRKEQKLIGENTSTYTDLTIDQSQVLNEGSNKLNEIKRRWSQSHVNTVTSVISLEVEKKAYRGPRFSPNGKTQRANYRMSVEASRVATENRKIAGDMQIFNIQLAQNNEYPILNTELPLIRQTPLEQPPKLPILGSLIQSPKIEEGLIKIVPKSNREGDPITFSVGGGFGTFSKRIVTAQQELRQLSAFRGGLEAPQEAFFFNLRLDKQLANWGLGVYSGITYNQYNERIFHQYGSTTERELFTDRAFYINQVNGERFFIPGIRIQRTTITGEINRYNETRILKMPLGVTFQRNVGQLNIGVYLGTAFIFYNEAKGDIVQLDNQLIDKTNFGTVDAYPMQFYSFQSGLRARYPLFRQVDFYASVNYDMDRIQIQGPNSMFENFRMLNLGFGLMIDLD